MEVGSVREKMIIAFFIYKFHESNVNANIPITESEIDVIVRGKPYSIKTISKDSGIKAVWTVDARSATTFIKNYKPKCDIILVRINWGSEGGVYLIPLKIQEETLQKLGRNNYLRMPKLGTNPRGVEFSKEAIKAMLSNTKTLKIPIRWKKESLPFNVYERWVEYWANV